MNKAKRKSLEAKGWKVGSVRTFLKLPRKLKKKYKRTGNYSALYTEEWKALSIQQKMRSILGLKIHED